LRRGQKTEGRGQKIEDVRLKMDLWRAGIRDGSGGSVVGIGDLGRVGWWGEEGVDGEGRGTPDEGRGAVGSFGSLGGFGDDFRLRSY